MDTDADFHIKRWYIVQLGDDCNRVLLNQTITLSDFIAANPEVNAGCTNLFLVP